ncbi:MAG: ATP-dependent nuclease [Sulfuricella sp.]
MKLQSIRLSNFQCFGPEPTELSFEDLTFLIGPNGSGKTAAMQALCRLFAFDPTLRRIKKSDFHVPHDEMETPDERTLWIEADFLFPELLDDAGEHPTIPSHFGHMRLDDAEGIPRVRFRLDASMGVDGDIEDTLRYVLDLNEDGSPLTIAPVPRAERNNIQIHYLPARRDPAEHIAFSTNALLGRLLRAVNWDAERESIKSLTDQISESLAGNVSVDSFSNKLTSAWKGLHKGSYFADPSITFVASEIEALLRHLSVSFSPGHDEQLVDFSRLSDGQKSMLYLSLVLSSQAIGRSVLSGEDDTFDPDKLKPAVFTLVAVEEPENSLSPHYLGRIVSALANLVGKADAQALIATHAPSMLRRVSPESIRYLRLTETRQTRVGAALGLRQPSRRHFNRYSSSPDSKRRSRCLLPAGSLIERQGFDRVSILHSVRAVSKTWERRAISRRMLFSARPRLRSASLNSAMSAPRMVAKNREDMGRASHFLIRLISRSAPFLSGVTSLM